MDVENTKKQFKEHGVDTPLEIMKECGHQMTLQKPFDVGYDIMANARYTPKLRDILEKNFMWKFFYKIRYPHVSLDVRKNKNFKFNFEEKQREIVESIKKG
jgi:hypothetical protein